MSPGVLRRVPTFSYRSINGAAGHDLLRPFERPRIARQTFCHPTIDKPFWPEVNLSIPPLPEPRHNRRGHRDDHQMASSGYVPGWAELS